MKGLRLAKLLGATAALVIGTSLLAPSVLAEDTTGVANGAATNASIFNIADLKAVDGPACLTVGAISATDYDDDPGGSHAGPGYFHVTPNLDDTPLQCANKYIFINNPSGVLEIQKTIEALIPGPEASSPPTRRVVFHDERPGEQIKTDGPCTAALGDPATPGSVAHGLITTGQKTAAEIQSIINGCIQQTVGMLINPFPVSKHLPPGWYLQCATLATTGGGASPEFCVPFHIEAISGFIEDVTTVDFGNLIQNVTSIDQGDFNIATANIGTVMGVGNTSPILLVAYSEMENNYGDPTQHADNKYITRDFDVQINRRNTAGTITAFQKVNGMLGGADPHDPDPFLGATVATLNQICLEPNEPLKMDFSVTPRDVLYPGTYAGLVRMTITTVGACTPTIGDAENAGGDGDGDPFNNLPGSPVRQTVPAGF